jgi:hypothetical protein
VSLKPSPGRCPDEARGKRVRVVLRNGYDTAKSERNGWPADGRGACNWSRDLGPWTIESWEIVT